MQDHCLPVIQGNALYIRIRKMIPKTKLGGKGLKTRKKERKEKRKKGEYENTCTKLDVGLSVLLWVCGLGPFGTHPNLCMGNHHQILGERLVANGLQGGVKAGLYVPGSRWFEAKA